MMSLRSFTMTTMNKKAYYSSVKKLNSGVIYHDEFRLAFEQIKEAYNMKQEIGIPTHIICTGESGTGKSTLKRQIAKEFPPYLIKDRKIIPILVVDTPAIPTIKSLSEAVLIELNDPLFKSGSAMEKTQRILLYLKQFNVNLIIFDELQHFIDQGKEKGLSKASDWLKMIIDHSNSSIVLMGLTRSEYLLTINEQLRRRFSSRIALPPFSINNMKSIKIFATVLSVIEKNIDFPCSFTVKNSSNISTFYYATNGIISYIIKLYEGAIEYAFKNKLETIDRLCFEYAFTYKIWNLGVNEFNPFHSKFNNQRLDRPNMPFYKVR